MKPLPARTFSSCSWFMLPASSADPPSGAGKRRPGTRSATAAPTVPGGRPRPSSRPRRRPAGGEHGVGHDLGAAGGGAAGPEEAAAHPADDHQLLAGRPSRLTARRRANQATGTDSAGASSTRMVSSRATRRSPEGSSVGAGRARQPAPQDGDVHGTCSCWVVAGWRGGQQLAASPGGCGPTLRQGRAGRVAAPTRSRAPPRWVAGRGLRAGGDLDAGRRGGGGARAPGDVGVRPWSTTSSAGGAGEGLHRARGRDRHRLTLRAARRPPGRHRRRGRPAEDGPVLELGATPGRLAAAVRRARRSRSTRRSGRRWPAARRASRQVPLPDAVEARHGARPMAGAASTSSAARVPCPSGVELGDRSSDTSASHSEAADRRPPGRAGRRRARSRGRSAAARRRPRNRYSKAV